MVLTACFVPFFCYICKYSICLVEKEAVMSFAGHVLDMIRRTEESRRMLQERRDRINDTRQMYVGESRASHAQGMTSEAYEQACRDIRERERSERRYSLRRGLGLLGIAMGVILLLLLLFGSFVF